MKQIDRVRLTSELRERVGKIAKDLRDKMLAPGPVRQRAEKLREDEQVGEDFDLWTNLLSRRAAVLWVLKSVYVRVLEDRGLVSPGRILDPESQQLFEKLAQNLGETAFLRWVYKDLGSANGGLPELFAPQPAEVAWPSDALSRELITFWRHRDADTGKAWSFAEERFEGELMGDLYQELDPVVKDRFALCQTPDFVRAFILDRTLTPAIETFGADKVRLLDPACGSGHFLIDGLKRLVAATEAQHPDWERWRVVTDCLDRVVGMDINDYACALARARMVMTAAELCSLKTLNGAAEFHPHVYWADGLEQVERDQKGKGEQLALLEVGQKKAKAPRATLTRPEVRAALVKLLEPKFHAVVANPPYITEEDSARKEYHRKKVGKQQRYVSAYREYSLACPFTERILQLSVHGGFVGIISGNSFMRARFGQPLIEKVLARYELISIVDTSFARIPNHDTPTVILVLKNLPASGAPVSVVMGKRGDLGSAECGLSDAAWAAIFRHADKDFLEDEFVSVSKVERPSLSKWPWPLSGGTESVGLKNEIERSSSLHLGELLSDAGATLVTRADPIYVAPRGVLERRLPASHVLPYVAGENIRDWTVVSTETAVFPYSTEWEPLLDARVSDWLLPYRPLLEQRVAFGKTQLGHGKTWFEYSMLFQRRLRIPRIAFSDLSSHNHFVLQTECALNNSHAPVLLLRDEVDEQGQFALLGILNSSVSCFWIKKVFKPKSSASKEIDKAGFSPENDRYEIGTTGMKRFPLPRAWNDPRVAAIAKRLCALGASREANSPDSVLSNKDLLVSADRLTGAIRRSSNVDTDLFRQMVFLQEELDWLVYELYEIWRPKGTRNTIVGNLAIEPSQRPFSNGHTDTLQPALQAVYAERKRSIQTNAVLSLIETAVHKRPWKGRQGIFGRYDRTYEERARTAMGDWLTRRIETELKGSKQPLTVERLAARLQSDPEILAVAEAFSARRDFLLSDLLLDRLNVDSVPSSPYHVYNELGLQIHDVWDRVRESSNSAEDLVKQSDKIEYKAEHFLESSYWRIRGRLDVPKERFIAFTEVPGRTGADTLYGWAGWTPLQRLRAILGIDEELEDAGLPLADRIALLDGAWRLLPDAAREDATAANRLKAELQALLGKDGPNPQMLLEWRERFPPPGTRSSRKTSRSS